MPKPRRLLSEERRRQILEWVEADGNVTTGALLQKLDVSPMTLWRDLAWLEDNSLIKRTRGGALSTNFNLQGFSGRHQMTADPSVDDPRVDERRLSIARRAVELYVRDGQTLVLEDGPITRRIPNLLHHSELRLASPSLGMLALLARRNADQEVFSCGGVLDSELLTFRGAEAEAFFTRLHSDCYFLSLQVGQTRSSAARHSLDRINKAMMRSSERNVLLAESGDLSRLDITQQALPELAHTVVTDDYLPEETHQRLLRHGIDVVRASEGHDTQTPEAMDRAG
ncbi:MAG: DeoR/GlpR family DNA-binding transcription regulator [Opitutales bacterium]